MTEANKGYGKFFGRVRNAGVIRLALGLVSTVLGYGLVVAPLMTTLPHLIWPSGVMFVAIVVNWGASGWENSDTETDWYVEAISLRHLLIVGAVAVGVYASPWPPMVAPRDASTFGYVAAGVILVGAGIRFVLRKAAMGQTKYTSEPA